MKLLSLNQFGDWSNVVGDLYIGNEFSPDPVDMIAKIQTAYPITKTDSFFKALRVQAKISVYDDMEDLERLLKKNGYTKYNPPSILLVDNIEE